MIRTHVYLLLELKDRCLTNFFPCRQTEVSGRKCCQDDHLPVPRQPAPKFRLLRRHERRQRRRRRRREAAADAAARRRPHHRASEVLCQSLAEVLATASLVQFVMFRHQFFVGAKRSSLLHEKDSDK